MKQQSSNPKLVRDYNGNWENNPAFIYAIKRKRDKAFSSMPDYVAKRDRMILYYREKRKGQELKHGERKRLSFEMSGFGERLKPALYIVGFIALAVYALYSKAFAPKDASSIDVFGVHSHDIRLYLPMAYGNSAYVTQLPVQHTPQVSFLIIIPIAVFVYALYRFLHNRIRAKIKPSKEQ